MGCVLLSFGYKITEKPQIPSDNNNLGPASIYNFELVISSNSIYNVQEQDKSSDTEQQPPIKVPFCYGL